MRRISGVARLAGAAISLPDIGKTCRRLLAAAVFLIGLTPSLSWACACGCGVYEVGTASLFPRGAAARRGSSTISRISI